MKITVLTGGSSEERDVAFASAVQIVAGLRDRGHQVAVVDTVTGVLSPQEEQAVLKGSVGVTPPSTRELVSRERAFLLSGLGALREIQEADVLFLALSRQSKVLAIDSTTLETLREYATGAGPDGIGHSSLEVR